MVNRIIQALSQRALVAEAQPQLPGDLVSIPEASVRLNIRKETLYRWLKDGRVRYWTGPTGRCVRVSMADLLAGQTGVNQRKAAAEKGSGSRPDKSTATVIQ
jgi:excisionase family DNA binding protein